MNMFAVSLSLGVGVPEKAVNHLLSGHLKVAAATWSPFIIIKCNGKDIESVDNDCPDEAKLTYTGILWEFLEWVKRKRNVTFSILRPSNPTWGYCHGMNNCSGMIGMVNRREVDFALGMFKSHPVNMENNFFLILFLGPFTQTINRAQAVEFSTPIGVMAYYTILVPLGFRDNLLSITNPLSLGVWICFLFSIPSYVVAMSLMNYLYSGKTNWERVSSIIIRGALSEHKNTYIKPPKHLYQKLLVLVWSYMMVVLISAYQGNLLAIITKPTMNTQFTDVNGMVEQTQIKWAIWDGDSLFTSYARSKPPGSPMRRIIDQAIKCPDFNCNVERKSRDIAHVSDVTTHMSIMGKDFSATGTCNYYLTQDKILATDSALAFPVSKGPEYVPLYLDRESHKSTVSWLSRSQARFLNPS